MQDNSLRHQRCFHRFPDVVIEAAQRQGLTINQVDLGTQGTKNAGKFERNVTRPDHDDVAWHGLQVECVV